MSERRQAAMALAYPLRWPEGYPRRKPFQREHARFKIESFARARDQVLSELRLLGARYVVLSTNVPVYERKGNGYDEPELVPYANLREPDDPGVAVYFDLDKEQRVIPCDRWHRTKDNMLAVARTVEAMRGIDRWGTGEMMKRAFSAFAALPPPASAWRDVFGLHSVGTTLEQVKQVYRDMAFRAHPDRGGSQEAMATLNVALQAAEKEFGG